MKKENDKIKGVDDVKIEATAIGSDIPEGEEQMQYIEKMTKALAAWSDLNPQRGFMIIACGENASAAFKPEKKQGSKVVGQNISAFAFGGNRLRLAAVINALVKKSPDFRNFLKIAARFDGIKFDL